MHCIKRNISLFFVQLAMMAFLLHSFLPHSHGENGGIVLLHLHKCEHHACEHHHCSDFGDEVHFCHNYQDNCPGACHLTDPFMKGDDGLLGHSREMWAYADAIIELFNQPLLPQLQNEPMPKAFIVWSVPLCNATLGCSSGFRAPPTA